MPIDKRQDDDGQRRKKMALWAVAGMGAAAAGGIGYMMYKNKDKFPKAQENFSAPFGISSKQQKSILGGKDLSKKFSPEQWGSLQAWKGLHIAASKLKSGGHDVPFQSGLHRKKVAYKDFSPKILEQLGFQKSMIAVPERGQTQWTTYRHPKTFHHLHKHKKDWYMHRDKFLALQLAMQRIVGRDIGAGLGAVGSGIHHLATEGIPGGTRYIKNKLSGAPNFEDISNDLKGDYPLILKIKNLL